jgi:hypothetical protein
MKHDIAQTVSSKIQVFSARDDARMTPAHYFCGKRRFAAPS